MVKDATRAAWFTPRFGMETKLRQATIDFNRGDQLGLIENLQLVGSTGISRTSAKAVLKAIDGFGRECWASAETIATRANVSRRTCLRAIDYLESLSLICVGDGDRGHRKRRNANGSVTNTIRIVWTEIEQAVKKQRLSATSAELATRADAVTSHREPLALLLEHSATDPDHGATVAPYHSATSARHGATVSDHGATSAYHGATVAPKSKETKEPPPTETREAAVEPVEDWVSVALRLRQVGLDRTNDAIRAARDSQLGPSDVFDVIAEFERHRTRFRSSGAIIERIRSGHWPVSLESKPPSQIQRDRTREILAAINTPKEERAKGFTDEDRRLVAMLGRSSVAAQPTEPSHR